jgi:hypothetical protein
MSNGVPASQVTGLAPVAVSEVQPMGFIRVTWDRWKKIARAVGVVQTRVLMVVFYFILVCPLGLIMRLAGDPLRLKARAGSNWTPHRHEDPSLDVARRQF